MQLIYRLTSPSGRAYIGQTKDLKTRMAHYRYMKCKKQRLLYRSLLKYGFQNHVLEVIHRFPETVSQNIIDNFERYVIQMHKYMTPEGLLNLTDGGRGTSGVVGYRHSDETRAKISAALKGKGHPHTEESKRKIGAANKGNKRPDLAARGRSRLGKPGRPHSKETKAKIRAWNIGRVFSETTRARMSKAAKERKLREGQERRYSDVFEVSEAKLV